MSLRRSLILAFSIVLTIVGVLSAVYAYESSRKEVRDLLDLQQSQIAHLVGNGGGFADGANQKADLGNEDGYTVEIRFADGRPTRVSRPGIAFPEAITAGFSDFRDATGDWRLFTLIDGGRTVRVAQFLAERGELATDAAITAALPMLVAIPLAWLIVWALVGAIVGRLEPVVAQVERREADDTDPIDLGHGPTELRPLVDAMNRAFARQRAAAEQQKQFLSDAAHELRTPLTALTLQIDNLRRANADPALDGPLGEANAGIRRASALTSRLLQLARQEAQATPRSTTEVRLDDVALRVIGDLVGVAEAKGVDLGAGRCDRVQLRGDEADLVALVEILVDNAVRYTPSSGVVDVSVVVENGTPCLIVEDTGPGIPEEWRERVFDRFFRLDETASEGTGLGLAIARVIAGRHGATIALDNRRDRTGLRATVRFPAATAMRHPGTFS